MARLLTSPSPTRFTLRMRFTSAVACGILVRAVARGTDEFAREPARCELLDVRAPIEQAVEQVPDAVNTPLEQLLAMPRRTAARPRDPRDLPLWPARLLRDTPPAATRVQSPQPHRWIAVTRDSFGALRRRCAAYARRPRHESLSSAASRSETLKRPRTSQQDDIAMIQGFNERSTRTQRRRELERDQTTSSAMVVRANWPM